MKFAVTSGLLVLSSMISIAANAAFLDKQAVLEKFLQKAGSLKFTNGQAVSPQLAEDLIENFSGSEGNRVLMSQCESAANAAAQYSCTLNITQYFGRHGEPNGLSDVVTYKLTVTENAGAIQIQAVTRSVSQAE